MYRKLIFLELTAIRVCSPEEFYCTFILQILQYKGIETLEQSWVRSVLLTPGSSRKNLMMWVLSYLCPTEAAVLPTAPEHTHTQSKLSIVLFMLNLLQIFWCITGCVPILAPFPHLFLILSCLHRSSTYLTLILRFLQLSHALPLCRILH